jgi:hypothetical protein
MISQPLIYIDCNCTALCPTKGLRRRQILNYFLRAAKHSQNVCEFSQRAARSFVRGLEIRLKSINLLKPLENNYGNKITSHTVEFLKDLMGTKGINVEARELNN